MSLPPLASWLYDFKPKTGSKEEKTLSLLKKGIEWA
jgi:coproporphyrinogen III oxidase